MITFVQLIFFLHKMFGTAASVTVKRFAYMNSELNDSHIPTIYVPCKFLNCLWFFIAAIILFYYSCSCAHAATK